MTPWRFLLARLLCRLLPPLVAGRVRKLLYPLVTAERDNFAFQTHALTGACFEGYSGDYYAYHFAVHGFFDWRNLAVALAVCEPGDTIIEIGANIGTETLGFADIVGERGRVYAVEPLPANVAQIQHNLQRNGYTWVDVLPHAMGEEDGQVHFTVPRGANSGLGHIVYTGEDASSIQIEITSLDNVYGRGRFDRPPKAIFIDVEGAEIAVLGGASATISRFLPYIILEAAPIRLAQAGLSVQDLYAQVVGVGYVPFAIAALGVRSLAATQLPDTELNWLCLHQTQLHQLAKIKRMLLRCGVLPWVFNPLYAVGGKK